MNALFHRHEVDPLHAETIFEDHHGRAEPRVTLVRKARRTPGTTRSCATIWTAK
jgi:hypothetical protein